MKQFLFGRRTLGLGIAIAACAALPAQSAMAGTTPATTCPDPAISQPFLSIGDSNWYTLAPGQTVDNFDGTGWILTGGAHVVSTTLSDGTTGQVLDLPAGSTATSSAMCVSTGYPTARMVTKTLGTAADNSTTFSVAQVGSSTSSGPMPVMGKPVWAVSPPVNVAPGGTGAEQVQFKFKAGAKAADLRVYDLYIDPRMKA